MFPLAPRASRVGGRGAGRSDQGIKWERQGLQAAVLGQDSACHPRTLSPSIADRSKRLELGLARGDVTIARKARRWSWGRDVRMSGLWGLLWLVYFW